MFLWSFFDKFIFEKLVFRDYHVPVHFHIGNDTGKNAITDGDFIGCWILFSVALVIFNVLRVFEIVLHSPDNVPDLKVSERYRINL